MIPLPCNTLTYLGVTVHTSWSHHIHTITNKVTRTLNLIKHILFKISKCSKDVKVTVYSTLVRPTLEYATIMGPTPHAVV